MPTPRKKTSGFSAKPDDAPSKEESVDVILETPQPQPFVEESIIPTEDTGPRFATEEVKHEKKVPEKVLLKVPEEGAKRIVRPEPVPEPAKPVVQSPPPAVHPPKRNPRNIPRFSRHSAK